VPRGAGAASDSGPSAARVGDVRRAVVADRIEERRRGWQVGRNTVSGGGATGRRVRPVSGAWEREPHTRRTGADLRRKKMGRAQVNSRISDLFELIQTSSN
jgi:hypothetical protein